MSHQQEIMLGLQGQSPSGYTPNVSVQLSTAGYQPQPAGVPQEYVYSTPMSYAPPLVATPSYPASDPQMQMRMPAPNVPEVRVDTQPCPIPNSANRQQVSFQPKSNKGRSQPHSAESSDPYSSYDSDTPEARSRRRRHSRRGERKSPRRNHRSRRPGTGHESTADESEYPVPRNRGYNNHYRAPRGSPGADRHARSLIHSIPKGLKFTGKGSWKSFFTKFSGYARMANWSENEKLEQLCFCLEEKASEVYTQTRELQPRICFRDIILKLEKRFGFKELPETIQVEFQTAVQGSNEDLTDWADRAMHLASKAYVECPDDIQIKQGIMRFCQGCSDSQAGQQACLAKPATIEAALDIVKWYKHTRVACRLPATSADTSSGKNTCRPLPEPNVLGVGATSEHDDSRMSRLEGEMKSLSQLIHKLVDDKSSTFPDKSTKPKVVNTKEVKESTQYRNSRRGRGRGSYRGRGYYRQRRDSTPEARIAMNVVSQGTSPVTVQIGRPTHMRLDVG